MSLTLLFTTVAIVSLILGFQINSKLLKKNKKRVTEVLSQWQHDSEKIKSLESKMQTLEQEKVALLQKLATPGSDQQKLKIS